GSAALPPLASGSRAALADPTTALPTQSAATLPAESSTLATRSATLPALAAGSRAALSTGPLRSSLIPAAELLAGRGILRVVAVDLLLCGLVPVLHALAILGIVLPRTAVALAALAGGPLILHLLALGGDLLVVHVLGEVVVVVVVDVDVAAAPVAVAPDGGADRHADPEREQRRARDVSRRIVRVGRIRGVRPSAVDDRRVVLRHVDDLWIRGLDLDHLRRRRWRRLRRGRRRRHDLDRHLLLLRVLERALGLRLRAQALHSAHEVRLLGQHGVAELLGPVELLVHHRQDRGKGAQRLHAVVPRLLLELLVELRFLEIRVVLHEA